MQPNVPSSTPAEPDFAANAANDLGPLAWVLDELRKSLEGAAKALKRFLRDAEVARRSDLISLDDSQLRFARQQLHQAVGALEMVGLAGPALVIRAMESAVQKFVQQPEHCTKSAASRIERASFALTEYLGAVLAGRSISAVALFPQYREVHELVKSDRIHPADLWALDWRWTEPLLDSLDSKAKARGYDDAARAVLDRSVLQLMKGEAPKAALILKDLSLGFAAAQVNRQTRIFWQLSAAYFEALAYGLIKPDVYVRRASSRILMQYASLASDQGGQNVQNESGAASGTGTDATDASLSNRLAHDLLFFCAQAVPVNASQTPVLFAVRKAYDLARFEPVSYDVVQFGRFDPALLAQARKRITSAKETWSSLSAGEVGKIRLVADQFKLVTDSLVMLHPSSQPLADALTLAVATTVSGGKPPPIEMAMEVATSVLYLEAAFDDLHSADLQLTARTADLAQRLEAVRAGGAPQPLQLWMQELYRRVSDKHTMGSVVGELHLSLSALEKSLDVFFRNPRDKASLQLVPAQLSQMRGVLSVLGLEQACRAVLRMKDSIQELLVAEVGENLDLAAGTFDHLGNNLGALNFLIDMLNYQPALVKKLFVYDEENGELKPLMGRIPMTSNAELAATTNTVVLPYMMADEQMGNGSQITSSSTNALTNSLTDRLNYFATQTALTDQPKSAHSAGNASTMALPNANAADATNAALAHVPDLVLTLTPKSSQSGLDDPFLNTVDFKEDDLQGIFLEEAQEVLANGLDAITQLTANHHDATQLIVLRRAFHTLKGSARMVGLNEFSSAAWSFEQLFNSWLADGKPANNQFLSLCVDTMKGLKAWIADIPIHQDTAWSAQAFRESADAMRQSSRYIALNFSMDKELDEALEKESDKEKQNEREKERARDGLELANTALWAESAQSGALSDHEAAILFSSLGLDIDLSDAFEPLMGDVPEWSSEISADSLGSIDYHAVNKLDILPTQESLIESIGVSAEGAGSYFKNEAPILANETPMPAETMVFDTAEINDFASNFAATMGMEDIASSDMPELPKKQVVIEPSAVDIAFDSAVEQLKISELVALAGQSHLAPDALFETPKVLKSTTIGLPVTMATATSATSVTSTNSAKSLSTFLKKEAARFPSVIDHPRDDQIKVIGSLRIGIPLYNVYLNEADEWSRRLVTEVAEWSLEWHQPISESTVALAHSLAGSSATVGFKALSEIARALEHALQQSRAHDSAGGADRYGQLFIDTSEDIRRLLHQFAVGFLREPNPKLLEKLKNLEFPDAAFITEANNSAFDLYAENSTGYASLQSIGTLATSQPLVKPIEFSLHDEDEIDVADAIDPELFAIFEEEGAELLPQLGGALRQWSARPDNPSARLEVLRVLHTLKGSARLAGAMQLGEKAHRIESEIESLGSGDVPSGAFAPLLNRFDTMQLAFEGLRRPQEAAKTHLASLQESESAPAAQVDDGYFAMDDLQESAAPAVDFPAPVSSLNRVIPPPQVMAMQPVRQAANASVRVRSQLLDRMVNQAGEVIITRSRLDAKLDNLRGSLQDMSSNLDKLRQQLRDIELQAENQMQSRLAQAKEAQAGFDPLESDRFTRVQELTRMMAESVNDVATVQRNLERIVQSTEDDLIVQARQTRELQRDLLRTRMVEFEGISERLYRVVRQASKETGKQVRLDLLGGTIEMDRSLLDRMTPAFEHLLRNGVVHGIENPQSRADAGKDPVGLITVHLRQEGNDVSVAFSDDGAGLDLPRIREKAQSLGLTAPGQRLDDAAAANMIFVAGVSTATEITELAGRGIGMDVVRSEVTAVGGRIETTTVSGKGTNIKLVLPLTTAVTQVVMIRTGGLSVGVPANLVENVRRVTARDMEQAYARKTIDVPVEGGEPGKAFEAVPFFWSGTLLQASPSSTQVAGKTSPVVIFKSASQRIALHVDEVLGNQEVVVKNLGPQMARLPGLAGMSVLASGAVVLIYNPVALAAVYGEQARLWSHQHMQQALETSGATAIGVGGLGGPGGIQPKSPLILIVDDSITVRRVTQRLLVREGYRVSMAADGVQALERLREEIPSVVLSDIEMPRMDGFDLARNIRTNAALVKLPIIMITSRIAEKHREHAFELGVNEYLGKPYSEDELMRLVRQYCAVEDKVTP